ncbi:unnamed protein product [Zymoseptoria tritici ST99CH_1A5]|uniref:Uncharacterized protein n=2 Tax=Zymoseptoria tritici TaxID=1047171 RepID=A0A2H1HBU1_ZYMTR|nr:unnamed protein product [Zymoseptoria tritici ST99CH_1E4]SMY30628.1 unnamed protein product [Zymoseptoria tritici ST99CH_1A5]
MAMRNPDELRAIWRNELPQRMMRELQVQLRIPKIRPSKPHGDTEELVIYLNFPAGHDGCGPATDKYEFFLTALDISLKMKGDRNDPAEVQAFTTGRAAFEAECSTLHGEKRIRKAVNAMYGGQGSTRTFFHSELDLEKLREKVLAFTIFHRNVVLPAAIAAGVSHIPLPGECGLAIKGYSRCYDHFKWVDSPLLFQQIQLIFKTVFPKRGFKLFQVYLFDVLGENAAEVGESIGTLFTNAYSTTGGTNVEQAGISQSNFQGMTVKVWKSGTLEAAKSPWKP